MIKVEIKGLNKLINFAEQYPEISEKYINQAINRSLLRIWGKEKTEAPFGVSGTLRDNWIVQVGRFEGALKANAPYALFVEEGTKPHMPPVDEITPWAKKKGINPWAVAISISKKGTKANPFLQRSVDAVKSDIEGEFATALQSAMDEVAQMSDN